MGCCVKKILQVLNVLNSRCKTIKSLDNGKKNAMFSPTVEFHGKSLSLYMDLYSRSGERYSANRISFFNSVGQQGGSAPSPARNFITFTTAKMIECTYVKVYWPGYESTPIFYYNAEE